MATSREMGARCRMLPWRTPVTEDPPDHQVADRSTTLHSLLISTRGMAAAQCIREVAHFGSRLQIGVVVRLGCCASLITSVVGPRICSLRPR